MQTDLLQGSTPGWRSRILPAEAIPAPAGALTPAVEINGLCHLLATQLLSVVPAAMLRKPVGNLAGQADAITPALDMLFQGF